MVRLSGSGGAACAVTHFLNALSRTAALKGLAMLDQDERWLDVFHGDDGVLGKTLFHAKSLTRARAELIIAAIEHHEEDTEEWVAMRTEGVPGQDDDYLGVSGLAGGVGMVLILVWADFGLRPAFEYVAQLAQMVSRGHGIAGMSLAARLESHPDLGHSFVLPPWP